MKSFWDPEALGSFRIGLGLYLIAYTVLCLGSATALFTDSGVLPMHVLNGLQTGKGYGSLYLVSRWWAWAYFLLFTQLLLSLCLTIGFRVRLIALPLAYLLWSLNARNPFLVGLAEEWIILLVLAAALLPVCKAFSVEDSTFRYPSAGLESASLFLGLSLLLATPAAWITEMLFTQSESSWSWFGLASLAGLLLKSKARNLAVLLFASWTVAVWYPDPLFLLGLLVGMAFCRLNTDDDESSESLAWLPLALAFILQLHWLGYRSGLATAPFPEKVTQQKLLTGDFYQQVGFASRPDRSRSVRLYSKLPDQSLLMRRYLNQLYANPNERLFPPLMTYFVESTEQLKVGESKNYTIFLFAARNAGGQYRTQTIPKNSEIWDRMPKLDRTPLQ